MSSQETANAQPAAASASNRRLPGSNHGGILSQLGRVNIAHTLVEREYSSAELFEFTATPKKEQQWVSDAWDLYELKVRFKVPSPSKDSADAEFSEAIIKSTGWGPFGPVELKGSGNPDDNTIPWPLKPWLEPTTATDLMKKAGYTGRFKSVTLSYVIQEMTEFQQPHYIFLMEDGKIILVNVADGKVQESKPGQRIFSRFTIIDDVLDGET